jgi:hypothetical protein
VPSAPEATWLDSISPWTIVGLAGSVYGLIHR